MFVGKDRSVSECQILCSSEKRRRRKVGQAGTNGKSKGCIALSKDGNLWRIVADRRYLYNRATMTGSKNIKKAGAQNVYFDYKHWTR